MGSMVTKILRIEVMRHSDTGLLMAVCDEFPGLYVHARSQSELDERLPEAIRMLMEAEGHRIGEIREISRPSRLDSGFRKSYIEYETSLAA